MCARAVAVGLICLAGLLGPAVEASAQAALPSADEEARARFAAGRTAYGAGHNEEALADFRRAYELSGRVELLFNIGQALDRLRRDAEAVAAFEEFVARTSEDATGHREASERAAFLRSRLAEESVSSAPATTPDEAPPTEHVTEGPGPGPIVLLVSSALVAAGGAVMLGLGEADRSTVESAVAPTSFDDIRAAYERGPVLEAVGIAALGLGVAGATAGIVWAVTGSASRPTSGSAELRVRPGMILVRGFF